MPSKEALRAEVAMLRAELEAMRRARAGTQPTGDEPDDDDDNDDLDLDEEARRGLEGQIREIRRAVEDLTEDARDEIAERPLVSVLAAFALGVIVGKLISR